MLLQELTALSQAAQVRQSQVTHDQLDQLQGEGGEGEREREREREIIISAVILSTLLYLSQLFDYYTVYIMDIDIDNNRILVISI